MKKPITLTLTLAAALLFTGCVTSGRKIDQTKVDQIQKGVTTRDEVKKLLGAPDQIIRDANGNTTFQYHYVRATAKGESFIPVIGAFMGGANVQTQFFTVRFGEDNKVADFTSTQGGTETSTGASTGSKSNLPDVEKDKRPK